MPVVLYRIDERLIHGQVVMGWGPRLRPGHYLVVDDELAEGGWEQELYRLGVPDSVTADFLSVADATARLESIERDPRPTVVLTRSVSAMKDLAEGGGLRGREVNLGGIHHEQGRTKRLPYVFLDPEDEADLRALEEAGTIVYARDLPTSRAVYLNALLG